VPKEGLPAMQGPNGAARIFFSCLTPHCAQHRTGGHATHTLSSETISQMMVAE
jgi:hypothetical protein